MCANFIYIFIFELKKKEIKNLNFNLDSSLLHFVLMILSTHK